MESVVQAQTGRKPELRKRSGGEVMTVILVAVTILFCLGLDWLVRGRKESAGAGATARALKVRLPGGIFFSRSHTWVNLLTSGKALVGVDDFVSRLVEEPDVTLLKNPGERVGRGEPFLRLSAGDRTLTLRSPIDAVVLTRNEDLVIGAEPNPGAQLSDGWAYAVRPTKPGDIRQLLLGEESRGWIREEFARLRDVFAGAGGDAALSPATLQDGGPPLAGSMAKMDGKVWEHFEREFLAER
jgi:glycine cleavage system H protein